MLNTTSFTLSISRFHLFFYSSSHGRFGRHVHRVSPGQCFWAARRKCLWRIGGANWREVQLGDIESVNGMVGHHHCSEDVCWIEFWSDFVTMCDFHNHGIISRTIPLETCTCLEILFEQRERHIVVFHANQAMKFRTWRVFGFDRARWFEIRIQDGSHRAPESHSQCWWRLWLPTFGGGLKKVAGKMIFLFHYRWDMLVAWGSCGYVIFQGIFAFPKKSTTTENGHLTAEVDPKGVPSCGVNSWY